MRAKAENMNQPQQSHGDDNEDDLHENPEEEIKSEELTTPESPPSQQTTGNFPSITNFPSAADILRPLSTLAAQHSFPLPTSGTLASLARGQNQHDPAEGRRADCEIESTSRKSSTLGCSLMHERLLQSDSSPYATNTAVLKDFVATSANESTTAAVRDFTSIVWESSTTASAGVASAAAAETAEATPESKPINRRMSAHSSSPFSSPRSSLVEVLSNPFDEDENEQTIFVSPFVSIYPDGTNPITPLFIQKFDDEETDIDDTEANDPHRTILQYSESIQLFRRRPEDGGSTWKRRVFEYR